MTTATTPETTSRPRRGRRPGWAWLTIAGALLGASGLVRAWQDSQLEAAAHAVETPPFPLAELPRDLGHWKAHGEDQELDPQTLTIAGASDYVARSYIDDRTGVVLSLIVVFGPAMRVVNHTPQVCFPAVGYSPASPPEDHTLALDSGPVRFRSEVFVKGRGMTADRQEAYHAFRHAGRWSPTAEATRKRFRLEPSMFKIQVQRRVGEAEGRGPDNPIESLLEELVPALERRIAEAAAGAQGRG